MTLTPDIAERVIYNIMNTPIRDYPCPHFVVENIWPDDFFERIRANLPATENYTGIIAAKRISAPEGTPDTRFIFSLETDLSKLSGEQFEFWKSIGDFLFGERFYQSILQKFNHYINKRFAGQNGANIYIKPVAELFRDMTHYAIGPHSDHTTRLLNLFFYLPEDDSKQHLGTSFYVPKDRTIAYQSGPHYTFDGFTRVFTAPFKRNAMAAFFKNDVSFHGVEPVMEPDFERNALAYFMRVQEAGAVIKDM